MSRAGLVSLVLCFLFIGLATSAPLAERLSSLAERYDDYINLGGREFDMANPEYTKREYLSTFHNRGFDLLGEESIKREYDLSSLDARDIEELEHEYIKRDDSDVHMLYRRRSIFTKIRDGFRKLGRAMKKGFHKVKEGFQKAGRAIKKGFQKVGTFIKKTAAKVAKFGLKIVAAVASVAAKVVKFIPGVGTGISMALKGVAIGTNAASNKIHANLGKLDKVTKGLDYVINPMSSVAKAAGKAKGGKAAGIVSSLFL